MVGVEPVLQRVLSVCVQRLELGPAAVDLTSDISR